MWLFCGYRAVMWLQSYTESVPCPHNSILNILKTPKKSGKFETGVISKFAMKLCENWTYVYRYTSHTNSGATIR